MLIIALVLALVGLAALVFAVVTSNELVAWVCIAASVLGVVLLIIDAVRERRRRDTGDKDEDGDSGDGEAAYVDYPEEVPDEGGPDAKSDVDESAAEAGTDASKESAVSVEGRGDDRK
jgi:membrane protein implicated in regulation of membrane protease activity